MKLGFEARKLEYDEIQCWLDGVINRQWPDDTSFKGLVAYCTDGVVTGIWQTDGWHLSSGFTPSPKLGPDNLKEVRIFGETSEIRLWHDGVWQGQYLADLSQTEPYLMPISESYLLIDVDRPEPVQGGVFEHLLDPSTGRRVVKPRGTKKMEVRHYLVQDTETGVVRIATSRFVGWR